MIAGYVDPGFDAVLAAFQDNFRTRNEVGASVAVWVEGRKVVDLWGGLRDKRTREPWSEDTLQLIFSATKGVAATALLMLVDRGLLSTDARVADYWPGFAAAGKEAITVAQLLDHTSGLCAIDTPLSLDEVEAWAKDIDRQPVIDALEAQSPLWKPGTAQGYHSVSFGFWVAELFRLVAGKSIGSFIQDEIAGPLDLDLYLGLPAPFEPRVSTLYTTNKRTVVRKILPRLLASRGVEGRLYRQFLKKGSATKRAFANPEELGLKGVANFNTARVRALELPWASAVANARGLGGMYQGLLSGDLVRAEILDPVIARQSWGWDKVLDKPMGFSRGYVKEQLDLYSPSASTFGHPGAGGSLGFADPENQVAFGYVMNRMDFRLRSPRALALARSVYDCL